MATYVGKQSNFVNALTELTELEYDAVEAYQEAINRVGNRAFKVKLREFLSDHKQHIELLNAVLLARGHDTVKKPSMKSWLTKGKVIISDMVGDDINILKAMKANEDDTNTAYTRLNLREDKWLDSDVVYALEKGLQDEARHKAWIEGAIRGDANL